MKKVVLLLFVLILFACDKDEVPVIDENETYIKITSVTPKSGTTIKEPLSIEADVKYNISLNELEGLGFKVSRWIAYDEPKTENWVGDSFANSVKLTKRSGENHVIFRSISQSDINYLKGRKIYLKLSISRMTSETTAITIIDTEPLVYHF